MLEPEIKHLALKASNTLELLLAAKSLRHLGPGVVPFLYAELMTARKKLAEKVVWYVENEKGAELEDRKPQEDRDSPL